MTLSFSTKAGTLKSLSGHLRSARILPLAYFTVAAWQNDRHACLERVSSELGSGPWIVRSSCRREDGTEGSSAGAFLSLADVESKRLEAAIKQVIDAYGLADPLDEVLIQPMLYGVRRAGVAFSHDPNTCAPYREFRGQCGSAMPRNLAGETPAWVIASHEPSIEPCGANANARVDASARKQARCKGSGWSRP